MDNHFLVFILALSITAIVSFIYAMWRGRRDEQKLISIIHGSPIPTFVLSKDHKIIYWNRALQALSNISPSQIIGTNQQWRAFYATQRPCLADLILDGKTGQIVELYSGKWSKSKLLEDAYEVTKFFLIWARREYGFVSLRRDLEIPAEIYSALWRHWKILPNKKWRRMSFSSEPNWNHWAHSPRAWLRILTVSSPRFCAMFFWPKYPLLMKIKSWRMVWRWRNGLVCKPKNWLTG